MQFKWDENKHLSNVFKHSVTFKDACHIFSDKSILTLHDKSHSFDEDRWISLGVTNMGKILVVVHTFAFIEGEELVRIISARKANSREHKIYYERKI
jgi:hypothetical protein